MNVAAWIFEGWALGMLVFVIWLAARRSAALEAAPRAVMPSSAVTDDPTTPTPSGPVAVHHAATVDAYLIIRSPIPPLRPPQPERRDACIVAHRAWLAIKLGQGVVYLRSMVLDYVWPFGTARSALPCGSQGFHAYKDSQDAAAYAPAGWNQRALLDEHPTLFVYGTVALWGKVIEHELGFRAEYAYPLHVVCPDEATARAISRWYGCETTVENQAP